MSKSPAFQFYAADYLADEKVQVMSLEEEGIYIRLLAYCWREGSIPADPVLIARLVGKGADGNAIEVVKKCFEVCSKNPSRLIHNRLEKERRKQSENSKRRSASGKTGAKARWDKGVASDGKRMANASDCHNFAIDLPMAKNGSSISSSSSISTSVCEYKDPLTPKGGEGESASETPVGQDSDSETSPANPGLQISPELSDLIAMWNRLADSKLVPHRVSLSQPSEAVLRAWKRSRSDSGQRQRLSGITEIESKIRGSPFCRGAWFRFEKLLFGRNQDREFILTKLLDGGYASGRNERPGVGIADHDPNASPRVF